MAVPAQAPALTVWVLCRAGVGATRHPRARPLRAQTMAPSLPRHRVKVSRRTLELTRDYMLQYRPNVFLIEGPDGGRYSARSVNKIVGQAARRAGIAKGVT